MSHDLSYFSGPSTSGAERINTEKQRNDVENERHTKADHSAPKRTT